MDANFKRYPGRNYRVNFNALFHTIARMVTIKCVKRQYLHRTLVSA